MKIKINKKALLEEASKPLPKLTKLLNKFSKELRKNNIYTYLLLASSKDHPLGGGSAVSYSKKGTKVNQKDPVVILDKQFKKWKLKQGISIEHDWNKDGYNNINKGLK